jgi:hypothetical protein
MNPRLEFEDKLCMKINVSSNTYIPTNCNEYYPSFCHVPTTGLIFNAVTNITSKSSLEFRTRYTLLIENYKYFFSAFDGKYIIRYADKRWTIFENKEEQKEIGTFADQSQYDFLHYVIGIHQISYKGPETNESVFGYLKLSNAS